MTRKRRPDSHHPQVVVSLPGRTAQALKGELRQAVDGGADIVEIRLDRLGEDGIPHLSLLHEIPLEHEWVPLIATLRSRIEGGEGPDGPEEREALFMNALEALPFSYVDLELARDLELRRSLQNSFGRPVGHVISSHLPEDSTLEEVRRSLEDACRLGEVGKVVLPSTTARAVIEILPVLSPFRGRDYVMHTTGPSGALFRVLAPRLGMRWVFCSLGHDDSGSVESSQLPLGRMRAFVDAGPETEWYAVVGKPVGHSRSPEIYSAFLESARKPMLYVALEIGKEEAFQNIMDTLATLGLAGINVTAPLKEIAFKYASKSDDDALMSGAANTVKTSREGGTGSSAWNTDVVALRRILFELKAMGWASGEMLVIGSGGAARAAIAAGIESATEVHVAGRSPEAVAGVVKSFPEGSVHALSTRRLRSFSLVVHATPFGQEAGSTRLQVPVERALSPEGWLLDLVYAPREPYLRILAQASGTKYMDGWRMLVYQAAESFKLFTGRSPDESVVSQLLKEDV